MKDFVEELKWRGMIHDVMPGTQELLNKEMIAGYVGIDPTADSLHIGHLVSVMMLKHFQLCGHKPIVLVGGATGMIGDPSGKSEERNLLDEKTLKHNQDCIKNQLTKFLDFDSNINNKAEIVNNFDWMNKWSFLDFIRDIGKHITVNYMMSKDSVKKRLETGISFTEFSYQLVQGYDYLHLYNNNGCKLQMGGSDQWGNITTGTELIRRKTGGEAFALTCPLITKADGGKFGKTEEGNVWLDANKTSPYKFYQFWLNCSDEDSVRYIKIFTLFDNTKIDELIKQHTETPHLRVLQKALAEQLTTIVHSKEDYEAALKASEILFGKGTEDSLRTLPENLFLQVFDGVPQFNITHDVLNNEGIGIIELLSEKTAVFSSKSEVRRTLKEGGVQINKNRVNDTLLINNSFLLNNKYILVQKGKKNFYIIVCK